MKLDKAIEILSELRDLNLIDKNPDRKDAIKLGIEAMKLYQKLKQTTFLPPGYKLPGETEE